MVGFPRTILFYNPFAIKGSLRSPCCNLTRYVVADINVSNDQEKSRKMLKTLLQQLFLVITLLLTRIVVSSLDVYERNWEPRPYLKHATNENFAQQQDFPTPRTISNIVSSQRNSIPSKWKKTNFVTFWGEFVRLGHN